MLVFLFLVLTFQPFLSASDSQLQTTCGGDSQLQMFCMFGDEETGFFGIENIKPDIDLVSPDDEGVDTDGTLNLIYIASDGNGISSCSVYLDMVLEDTDYSVGSGNQEFIINNPPEKIDLQWHITCNDSFGNIGYSANRTITTGGGGFGAGLGIKQDITEEEEPSVMEEKGLFATIKEFIFKLPETINMPIYLFYLMVLTILCLFMVVFILGWRWFREFVKKHGG